MVCDFFRKIEFRFSQEFKHMMIILMTNTHLNPQKTLTVLNGIIFLHSLNFKDIINHIFENKYTIFFFARCNL